MSNSSNEAEKDSSQSSQNKSTVSDRAFGQAADNFGNEFKDVGQDAGALAKRAASVFLKVGGGVVWSMELVVDWFEQTVSERLQNVPHDQITEPSPRIMVPAMQALTYTGSDEDIREMFANLIAADFTKDGKRHIHPSFVELIKQMTPLDANTLKVFAEHGPQRYTEVRTEEVHPRRMNRMRRLGARYSIVLDGVTSDEISESVSNLLRLGLVVITSEYWKSPTFDVLDQELLDECKDQTEGIESAYIHPFGVELTPFGKSFAKICIL